MEEKICEIENQPFTIEQFFKFLKEKKIMAGKCNQCGKLYLPPRPVCSKCYSKNFEWIQLDKKGRLLTYTIIHVTSERFQKYAPYAYGILELKNGVRIPGIIKQIEHEKLKIGMELEVDFDIEPSLNWPQWPRYFLKPT